MAENATNHMTHAVNPQFGDQTIRQEKGLSDRGRLYKVGAGGGLNSFQWYRLCVYVHLATKYIEIK